MPRRLLSLFLPLCLLPLLASDRYPPPRFIDPHRQQKLRAAFPKIDALMTQFAERRRIPGMVWGVVIDQSLAHLGIAGVRDRESGDPVDGATVFRIASMTKSFTALAVLQLRDEGRITLEDPVSRWIPEFQRLALPTQDSAVLRVRHLLTHASGLPEDNPWGDQQLGISDEQLTAWLRRGVPFSTPPGTRYEYSNYAFALLGRIVARASGEPFDRYLTRKILLPLGMRATTLEASQVPGAKRATGYRLSPDGQHQVEPPLPHGAFGAMGGLWTSAEDLARYIAFHLDAFPARDGAETGPVRRSSVREMNAPAWLNSLIVGPGAVNARVSSYGYGLGVAADCRFWQIVSHSGGLPGFGSHMSWLPEYGVGLFAMANLTYAGPGSAIQEAWDLLRNTGGLEPRQIPPSRDLLAARERILHFWRTGEVGALKQVSAMNLFLDVPEQQRLKEVEALKAAVGECSTASEILAENWLRGQFHLTCEKGVVGVFITLAPTEPPAIQYLSFRQIAPGAMMEASTSAPFGIRCAP